MYNILNGCVLTFSYSHYSICSTYYTVCLVLVLFLWPFWQMFTVDDYCSIWSANKINVNDISSVLCMYKFSFLVVWFLSLLPRVYNILLYEVYSYLLLIECTVGEYNYM